MDDRSADLDAVGRALAEWGRERPDLDVSPTGVIARLHRLARHLTEELETVYRRHGLAEGDFDVLATLRRAGGSRTPGALAASTMITSGGMTKRIDRLAERGLVERRTRPDDGRGRLITLTDAGRELIDAAFTEHIANEHRLIAELGAPDAAELERMLARWLSRYE